MSLDLNADITGLRGADYNPRHITQDDLDALAQSISELGLVKPLIVRNDLLVAGHQRTKALRHLGKTHAAVYRLASDTSLYDEIRFNQLHNGTDLDGGDEAAKIKYGFDEPGWYIVAPERVQANMRCKLAVVRKEICELITKYGPWGGCVATLDGEIIHAAQYAMAAFLTSTPLTTFVLPNDKVALARSLLSKTYGVFSYDGLARQTHIQTLAQMYRLNDGESGKQNKSVLYERLVNPYLGDNPGTRAIDFGSGRGDYASAWRNRGVSVHDVELFRRCKGSMAFDVRAIYRMIDHMSHDLERNGRYDAVICDSVLNSVDCLAAETAVMTTLNMLVVKGGDCFFSGRPLEQEMKRANHTKSDRYNSRYVNFLDKDGFSALYRQGHWFYQKFHSQAQIEDLADRFGFEIVKFTKTSTSWQVHAKKTKELPLEQAIEACKYEFELSLGDNKPLGKSERIIAAITPLYENE